MYLYNKTITSRYIRLSHTTSYRMSELFKSYMCVCVCVGSDIKVTYRHHLDPFINPGEPGFLI